MRYFLTVVFWFAFLEKTKLPIASKQHQCNSSRYCGDFCREE